MSLKLFISHSVLPINTEKRFSGDLTVIEFKQKLELIVGTKPSNMLLQLRDNNDDILLTLQPDNKKLSEFNLKNYDNIHCVDIKPNDGIVSSLNNFNKGKSDVKKYQINEAEYAKRDGTFLQWKKQNKAHFDKIKQKKQTEIKEQEDELKEMNNKYKKIIKDSGI